MKKQILTLTMILTLLSTLPASAAPQEVSEQQSKFLTLEFKEEDSLKELAKKHLGSAENVYELLAFNQISNPALVKPGDLILIPKKIRMEAIASIEAAVEATTQAGAAQADRLAGELFARAQRELKAAQDARNKARYDAAVVAALQSRHDAKRALDLANITAVKDDPATLTFVQGTVETSPNGKAPWAAAKTGTKLPVSYHVRSAKDGRAEISFADGSTVQLLPSAQLVVVRYSVDQRNQRRNSRLRVLLGGIVAEIEPRENEASEYEIESAESSIAIRGTGLRVGLGADELSFVSTLHGLVEVKAQGKTRELPAGFGTRIPKGKPPEPPVKLPAIPEPTQDEKATLQTARLLPLLTWTAGREGSAAALYHLQIARDARFNAIVQDLITPLRAIKPSLPLAEGKYFWRVSGISKSGLEGKSSRLREMIITKHLGVTFNHPPAPLQQGDTLVFLPGHDIQAACEREDSSVIQYQVKLDGQPLEDATAPIRVDIDGLHNLNLVGVAADGSRGPAQVLKFRIDGSAPIVSASIRTLPATATQTRQARIELQAEDVSGVKHIQYRVNRKDWQPYTEPFTLELLSDAQLEYWCEDRLGNRSSTHTTTLPGQPIPR